MAKLVNTENNILFQICLNKIEEESEKDYETWISSEILLKSNVINCTLGKQINFALNRYELGILISKLNKLIDDFENNLDTKFGFSNCEINFEINMSTVTVDKLIECEVWINWASYTNGKDVGYYVGIRFVVEKEDLQVFLDSLNDEVKCL